MLKNEKMKRRCCLISFVQLGLCIFFACAVCVGDVIYVDASALVGGDGANWSSAYKYLQDGLAAAVDGDEIHLAHGFYRPDQGQGITVGDKTMSFLFSNSISIYGGYAGVNSDNPDYRDSGQYETILSGDLEGNDEPDFVNYDDNSFHVIKTNQGTKTIVLDGLTICSGNASNCSEEGGGGVYLGHSTNLYATDCCFVGNLACKGGAIYSYNNIVKLTDCCFRGNKAQSSGGAISSESSELTLTGCYFISNSASGNGGAIEEDSSQGTSLVHCIFNNNSAVDNGGAVFGWNNIQTAKAIFTNCVLYNNSSGLGAGGIVLKYFDLRNSILWANSRNGEVNQYTQFWNRFPLDEGTVSNCCIQGWDGDFAGVATIADDPLFADVNGVDGVAGTEDDNFRLLPESPCVDAGDSGLLLPEMLTDIDDFKRVLFGNVDIGAYEYHVMTVDDDAPDDPGPNNKDVSDPNECGSPAHPFDTIQEAMDVVEVGYTIEVLPGLYSENVDSWGYRYLDFWDKDVTLRSTDPNDWDVVNSTIISAPVYFEGSESADTKLVGFKIYNESEGTFIECTNSGATISNCNISGNDICGGTVISQSKGLITNCLIADNISHCDINPVISEFGGVIRNCTIVNNNMGIQTESAVIENTIIYNNQNYQIEVVGGHSTEISYCNIQGDLTEASKYGNLIYGVGNFDADPCFVRMGAWGESFSEGDYHLKSFGWRINEDNPSNWAFDLVTSRCIDAGNPGCSLGNELMASPNDPEMDYAINKRINMGAYGGTDQASLAPYDWSLLADLNNDGIVDFEDISLLTEDWLSSEQQNPGDLDRNGVVNMKDYALSGQIWHIITDWRQ